MIASFSSVTKAIISSIKQMNTIKNIIRSMGMNQINNNSESKRMCSINKIFKIIRRSKSLRNSKISGYMVAKTGIISMFLNGHQLNTIIPCILNSFKIILCKILIRTYPPEFLSHTDM